MIEALAAMSYVDILSNFIVNNVINSVWIYVLAVQRRFDRRKSILLCVLAGLCGMASSILSTSNQIIPATGLLAYFLVDGVNALIYIFLLQKGNKLTAGFLFLTNVSLWVFITSTSTAMSELLFYGSNLAILLIRITLNILFFLIYHYFIRTPLLRNKEAVDRAAGALVSIAAISYILLTLLFIYFAFNSEQMMVCLAAFCLLFLLLGAVYALIFRYIVGLKREAELHRIEMQNTVLTETIHHFETAENEARRIRHDQRHHGQVLLEYMKSGDTQAAIGYLSQYGQREQEDAPERLCANRTVDNILRVYLRKARENSITVTTDIAMREDTAVADVDLVAILGNMMENAINGCMSSKGVRAMELSIRHRGVKLVMQCRNTCAGGVPFENGLPVRKGGVGVSSILSSAKRYEGEAIFSEEDGIFTCAVLLNDMESSD